MKKNFSPEPINATMNSMSRIFCLLILGLTVLPVWGAVDYRNLKCACVGSKTPSHQDRLEIQKAFPAERTILRLLFKNQTYYVLTHHRKIMYVLCGWETGEDEQHIWAVLDSQGLLLEWLVFPQAQRIDMRKGNYSMTVKDDLYGDVFPEIIQKVRNNLSGQWPLFLSRVRLNLYKNDTIGQATP